ncbi:hypothetical protein D1007_49772 [Hordeum vulgare]|nr:hypothetical protein D1007_49772 [Hordeum vulgare]
MAAVGTLWCVEATTTIVMGRASSCTLQRGHAKLTGHWMTPTTSSCSLASATSTTVPLGRLASTNHLNTDDQVPPLLRLRGHNPNETLVYDPRYEPYFRRMDLLQFLLNFKGTPPWLNATTLTALTDRWRLETHSFHLPLGEMGITLEDIAMITGLPIEGRALTGKVTAAGWRQRVAALVGVEPEQWTDETRKDPRPSGVLFSWIQRHFHRCPKDASPLVVERFARAYLWNLLTQVVFPDGTGDTASWMFLDPLRDWDVKWSWGSAALAFLYRQLDGACMRSKPTSCVGGFVWALQVWMWERIPVGRNFSLAPEEPWKYPFDGDEERYPTITHTWANVQWTSIAAMGRYKAYISELDMLTYEQVNWRPYTVLGQFPNMCLRDQHLWRVRCPMICFYAVEWHLPHRVSKQTNRQSNKTVINWEEHHMTWVDMWNAQRQHRVENDETPDTDEAAYLRHLECMHEMSTTKLSGAHHVIHIIPVSFCSPSTRT